MVEFVIAEKCENKVEAKYNWDLLKDSASKKRYKETSRKTKRHVAIAKSKTYQQLYDRLKTIKKKKCFA